MDGVNHFGKNDYLLEYGSLSCTYKFLGRYIYLMEYLGKKKQKINRKMKFQCIYNILFGERKGQKTSYTTVMPLRSSDF